METYRANPSPGLILRVFVGVIVVLLIFRCFTVIPAGHVGVVDFFGSVSDATLKPGVNLRNPLASIHKFTVKTQEKKEVMVVPSKEGLSVTLEISAPVPLEPGNCRRSLQDDWSGLSDHHLGTEFSLYYPRCNSWLRSPSLVHVGARATRSTNYAGT